MSRQFASKDNASQGVRFSRMFFFSFLVVFDLIQVLGRLALVPSSIDNAGSFRTSIAYAHVTRIPLPLQYHSTNCSWLLSRQSISLGSLRSDPSETYAAVYLYQRHVDLKSHTASPSRHRFQNMIIVPSHMLW